MSWRTKVLFYALDAADVWRSWIYRQIERHRFGHRFWAAILYGIGRTCKIITNLL